MQAKRQTANKIWVSNLLKGESYKEEGEYGINYILVNNTKISRVNLIGTLVDIYKNELGNYISILLDDGSGAIKCRNWNEDLKMYEGVGIGSIVLVVGKVKEKNEEIYVVPEIVRLMDPIWLKIRNLELKKLYGVPEKSEYSSKKEEDSEFANEEASSGNHRQKILNLIEESGEGITYDQLISKSDLSEGEVNKVVGDLIKEGEIYEPKSGVLRILG